MLNNEVGLVGARGLGPAEPSLIVPGPFIDRLGVLIDARGAPVPLAA
jgi:hypothetical protein